MATGHTRSQLKGNIMDFYTKISALAPDAFEINIFEDAVSPEGSRFAFMTLWGELNSDGTYDIYDEDGKKLADDIELVKLSETALGLAEDRVTDEQNAYVSGFDYQIDSVWN